MSNVIFWKNDMRIKVTLRNPITNQYINDATVEARVKDRFGADVTGQSWPLTLGYIAASDGEYDGILEETLAVNVGDRVSIEITMTAPGGLNGFFKLPTQVRQRGKVY